MLQIISWCGTIYPVVLNNSNALPGTAQSIATESVVPPPRVCLQCGKGFIGRKKKYCSSECRRNYDNILHKAKSYGKRSCESCGGEYTAKFKTQKYCSEICGRKGIALERIKRNRPVVDGVTMKRCAVCKEYKPMDLYNYHHNSASCDGFSSKCKPCTKEKSRRYFQTPAGKASHAAAHEKQKASGKIYKSRKIFTCKHCGIEFRKKPTGGNKGFYCSRECSFKDYKTRFAARTRQVVPPQRGWQAMQDMDREVRHLRGLVCGQVAEGDNVQERVV
jgi:hypothetical protein